MSVIRSAVKKRSLEEAIKEAKNVVVGNNENSSINTIHKVQTPQSQFSPTTLHSRVALCDITNQDSVVKDSELNTSLRTTETLKYYIVSLEQKLHKLEKSKEKISGEYKQAVERINFYETMTGMTIKTTAPVADKNVSNFTCTVRNTKSRSATRFKVSIDHTVNVSTSVDGGDDSLNLQFVPVANPSLLPDYLRTGEIECSSRMGPILLGDIIQQLYHDENDD